jgi:nucleotide-binding universal stress UspA family protein
LNVRNILVPTDFSLHASRALDHGIDLARGLPATLHVLHAQALAIWCLLPDALPVSLELIEAERRRARLELEQIRERLVACDVRHRLHLSGLGAVHAILDVAERHDIDLIVIGSRGVTGVWRRLLGSVAERTARLAPCPVVIMRESDHSCPQPIEPALERNARRPNSRVLGDDQHVHVRVRAPRRSTAPR